MKDAGNYERTEPGANFTEEVIFEASLWLPHHNTVQLDSLHWWQHCLHCLLWWLLAICGHKVHGMWPAWLTNWNYEYIVLAILLDKAGLGALAEWKNNKVGMREGEMKLREEQRRRTGGREQQWGV